MNETWDEATSLVRSAWATADALVEQGDPLGWALRAVIILIALIVVGLVLSLLLRLLRALVNLLLRLWAGRSLGVRLRRTTRARPRLGRPAEPGRFGLAFPRWRYPKTDGTRDRRRSGNRLVRRLSVVEAGRWRLSDFDPRVAYAIVVDLRRAGYEIAPDELERRKAEASRGRARTRRDALDVDALIARFSPDPYAFEEFCAEVFEHSGYAVTRIPRSGDGGVDLILDDAAGRRTIVECKCYARSRPVGRPVVQKLFGANAVARADGMMVVTTSTFSRDALDFASQVGVRLIDGAALVATCRSLWGGSVPVSIDAPGVAELSLDDIRPFYPADARPTA